MAMKQFDEIFPTRDSLEEGKICFVVFSYCNLAYSAGVLLGHLS